MISETTLSALVQQYEVCWEVWPEICPGSNHTQVGFEVELFGTNPQVKELDPSSLDCTRIRRVLEAIVAHVCGPTPDVLTETYGDGHAIRYSPVRANRPDVTLSVKILHRTGYEQPVDENERAFLEEVKKRLRFLGAQEQCWRNGGKHVEKSMANISRAA